jgi:hypothetical protein
MTAGAITCAYFADNPESLRAHASCGGFPVTDIRQITARDRPYTAE